MSSLTAMEWNENNASSEEAACLFLLTKYTKSGKTGSTRRAQNPVGASLAMIRTHFGASGGLTASGRPSAR